jgi:hypothetical protein
MPPGLEWIADFMAANPSPEDTEEGKFYMVPCIEWRDWDIKKRFGADGIVPLIGTVHEDRDIIGFKPWHIHVDTRFLLLTLKNRYNSDPALALGAPVCLTGDMWGQEVFWNKPIPLLHNAKLLMRRKKCVRSQPAAWPSWKFTDPLEDAYANHCAANGTCPHRGLPLSGGREMGNGVRQCSGHGLCWGADGRMVRRQELVKAAP